MYQTGHPRASCSYSPSGEKQWTVNGKPAKEGDIPGDAVVRGCPPRAASIAAKMSPPRGAAQRKALPAAPPKKAAAKGDAAATASPPKRKLVIADRRLKEALEWVLTPAQFYRVVKTYESVQ
jgi:hypothetical protein